MLSFKNSIMLREADKAAHKAHFVIQILIFFAVFLVVQLLSFAVLLVPTLIWMFSNPSFISSAVAGDIDAAMLAIANMPEWMMIVQLFITAVETAAAVVYCRFIEKRSLRSMGFTRRGWLRDYLKGYAVGAIMILAACGISVLSGGMSVRLSSGVSVLYLLLYFAGYIVQGMAEETLVRGYFLISFAGSLKCKHAAAIATVVSSVLFAALHLGNPGVTVLAFINLVLAGVFFAVYMLRSDNIWGACAAHSAWNFFQGQIIGSNVSGLATETSVFTATVGGNTLFSGGNFGLEGGLAVTIVELAAILLVIFLPGKKRNGNDPDVVAVTL